MEYLFSERGIRLWVDGDQIRLEVGQTMDGVMVDSFVKRLTVKQARDLSNSLMIAADVSLVYE